MSKPNPRSDPRSLARIKKAADRAKRATEAADSARQALRELLAAEVRAGRVTKSGVADVLGVSRQRVQQLLD